MSLAAKLAADEVILTCWSGVPDSLTVEVMAGAKGFDAVTMDMQHGGHHEDSILRGLPPLCGQASLPSCASRSDVGIWPAARWISAPMR
jgi:2-keto-3-deoxy-L-rhamnonate aldolase RhmA